MALFSARKTRTRKAALRPPETFRERVESWLTDQHVLPRLLVVIVFLALLLLIVQAWLPVFPYRLGDRVDRGITARVAFRRINTFETERVRKEREGQVPFVFHLDNAPLNNVTPRLKGGLKEVASSESLEALSASTRAAFGFTASENSQTPPEELPEARFRSLKDSLTDMGKTADDQIDELGRMFDQFIYPLYIHGVADPVDLRNIRADQTLAIADVGNTAAPEVVSPAQVTLSEALKDSGAVGKLWKDYPDLNAIRAHLTRWMLAEVPPTLQFDAEATQSAQKEAVAKAQPIYFVYKPRDLLAKPGQALDEETISVLHSEYLAMAEAIPWHQRVLRTVTVLGLLTILVALNAFFLKRHEPKLYYSTRGLTIFLTVVLVTVLAARALAQDSWQAEVIPLVIAAMMIAISYNQMLAIITSISLTLIVSFTIGADLGDAMVLLGVCATAVIPLASVTSRISVLAVGGWTALIYFLLAYGIGILESPSPSEAWLDWTLLEQSGFGALKCLIAGYIVAGSLPLVESLFDIVTDISLLELSDISHELLQELVQRAPGTYNHSMTVASIGETAAEKIGANGLLVRVGAYFHDIGKMLKPQYFVENMKQGEESRHSQLAPAMSTLIIIGHVKDGVELARQYNLPQKLIDFVEQHHGTTLVEFFYREAQKRAGEQGHEQDVQEASFRYPGPKPQTKEAAILMLTDAVESASRTLAEPTPKRIEGLVHGLAMKRLQDGQFDECPLTLNEIRQIEESLVKSLIGIYHGRIKYPEQQSA